VTRQIACILHGVSVHRIFGGIGAFSVKFRWLVILAWVVAAVAIPKALPSLASVTQGNNSAFLPASAPSQHASDLAAPFGISNSEIPVPVVAAVSQGTLTSADQAWITGSLQHSLITVHTVIKVRDLGRSGDLQAEQLQVLSNVSQNDPNAQTDLISNLRAAIAKAAPPPGMQVHLAGQVAINVDQQKQSGNTGNQVQGVALIFILILLLLIFRSIVAPIVTVIPAFLAVAIAGPLIGEAAHAGLKVSQLSQLMLIVLVLGAGTDYGLFLVFRVREHLREGEKPKDAVRYALTRVGETITFSALTVIAALLSLLAATFQIYSQLGIPLAIGIGTMLLAGLTLLPALLAVLGRGVFWPLRMIALGVLRLSRKRSEPGGLARFARRIVQRSERRATSAAAKGGVWGRVAVRIVRKPAVPLAIGVVAFGALAIAVPSYKPGGFGGTISAPAGTDSAAGTTLLNKHFPQSSANPTNLVYKLAQPVWQNPQPLVAAEQQLKGTGLFTGITGPLNPVGVTLTPQQYVSLHSMLGDATKLPATPATALPPQVPLAAYQVYRATGQFVSSDGRTIQFQTGLKAGDPSTTAAMSAVPSVRTAAGSVVKTLGATDWGVGGEAPAFYDISQISDTDLVHVVPIAIVVIGLLLILVMRSLVAPIYLIASVALSFFAALGLSVIVFMKLGGDSGLTFILPFLMFVFLLALGEDYNILVMTRIREEAHKLPLRKAVTRALNATGTTVTSAGLVLAGTFAVFAVVGGRGSGGSQVRDVGIGLALGVLMDTFIVRTVLVPCTVILLGRWNWWPSKLARLELPDTGGELPEVERASARQLTGRQLTGRRLQAGAQVCLGVDRGGELAERGSGLMQGRLRAFRERLERHADDLLVDVLPAADPVRAFGGEVQGGGAPVRRAAAPGQVAGSLQCVEQRGHRAGCQAQHPGQLAWADAGVLGDAGQQLELGDRERGLGIGGPGRAAHGAPQPGHDVG
jgi:RND superfamily putative drug exporter